MNFKNEDHFIETAIRAYEIYLKLLPRLVDVQIIFEGGKVLEKEVKEKRVIERAVEIAEI